MRKSQPTEQIERRSYELRAESVSSDGPGGLKGIANVMGVMDAYRSVWSTKAYGKDVLKTFVESGFISEAHNWSEDVATIDDAKVSRNQLNISATFHSTDRAQDMRTKCTERISRGKTVGFSVGCMLDWSEVQDFDSGEKLWLYAEKILADDMSLYDPAIRKYKGYCWIIPKVSQLVETAITQCPAVPGSQATEARSQLNLLQDSELRIGLPLEEHLRLVRTANAGLEARLVDKAELATSQDRRPFSERLGSIVAMRDSLNSLIESCRESDQPDELNKRYTELVTQRRLASLRG